MGGTEFMFQGIVIILMSSLYKQSGQSYPKRELLRSMKPSNFIFHRQMSEAAEGFGADFIALSFMC